MALITNTMAGATIQPKFKEMGAFMIVCTQAIASDAASAQAYKLFNIASGCTLTDIYIRLSAQIVTGTTLNLGLATNGTDFISGGSCTSVVIQRGTGSLPYTCTADTPIYIYLSAAAGTAGNALVVATVSNDID